MVLLASTSKDIAEHALGGAVSSEVTPWRVLNEAGHWLCNARSWRWLRGGMEALATVADQPWVALPANFATLNSLQGGGGYSNSVQETTLDHILELRASGGGYNSSSFFSAAIAYDHADITGTSTTTGHPITPTTEAEARALKAPSPRLELYPTPTEADADAILLFYTRRWRDVREDTDTIFLPEFMEGLYHATVRAWAKGYEEADTFDLDAALARLQMGPVFIAAARTDTAQGRNLGILSGGAALTEGKVPQKPWFRTLSRPY